MVNVLLSGSQWGSSQCAHLGPDRGVSLWRKSMECGRRADVGPSQRHLYYSQTTRPYVTVTAQDTQRSEQRTLPTRALMEIYRQTPHTARYQNR